MKHSLEGVWEAREEVIYPRVFGPRSRGIFTLDEDIFVKTMRQESADPRWLYHGVFEHGPTARGTYYYVTSGTSNPWDVEPGDYPQYEQSGFGSELVLEASESGDWAILALQRLLALQVLLGHGCFQDRSVLELWDCEPLGSPITPGSALTHALIAPPAGYEPQFVLPSGTVKFLHVVGITENECNYAKTSGSDRLVELLKARDGCLVTDPQRWSVIE